MFNLNVKFKSKNVMCETKYLTNMQIYIACHRKYQNKTKNSCVFHSCFFAKYGKKLLFILACAALQSATHNIASV